MLQDCIRNTILLKTIIIPSFSQATLWKLSQKESWRSYFVCVSHVLADGRFKQLGKSSVITRYAMTYSGIYKYIFLWFESQTHLKLLSQIGCILTKQFPIQLYTAIYYVAMDIVMIVQYIYYHVRHIRQLKAGKAELIFTVITRL